MPFTDYARATMLNLLFEQDGLSVAIGRELAGSAPRESEFYPPLAFWTEQDGPSFRVNREDITFGRAPLDEQTPLTHWLVFGRTGALLAHDKLERPILLRKGERATFPAGSLRLELK